MPHAPGPAVAPLAVTFYANASKLDLSFDARLGRTYSGHHGEGTIEVAAEGLRIVARRHRYAINLAAGALFGLLVAVMFTWASRHALTDASRIDVGNGAPGAGFFGALIGAWLASLTGRLAAPDTRIVTPGEIESAKVFGTRIHLFLRRGGDVAFVVPTRDAHQGVLQWLHASGIHVAWG